METYVRCFTGSEGLRKLKPEWDELFAEASNAYFYNDWRWHNAIQRHLYNTPIYYFAVYHEGQLNAIVPLALSTRKRQGMTIRYFTFPYDTPIDIADCLVRRRHTTPALLHTLVAHLKRHSPEPWDIIELSHFSDRSTTYQLVENNVQAMTLGSAYVQNTKNHNLIESLSKKQVKNSRRHQKNAESRFSSIRFQSITDKSLIEKSYETFLTVEASSWKGESGTQTAIRLKPNAKAFYQELLFSFSETNEALINLLEFNGSPVAAQFGLRSGTTLHLLKIGYDEQFRDVGPGGIALLYCLNEESCRSTEVNLVTNPPWASRWHFSTEKKWSSIFFNKTLKAQLLYWLHRFREKIVTFRHKKPT